MNICILRSQKRTVRDILFMWLLIKFHDPVTCSLIKQIVLQIQWCMQTSSYQALVYVCHLSMKLITPVAKVEWRGGSYRGPKKVLSWWINLLLRSHLNRAFHPFPVRFAESERDIDRRLQLTHTCGDVWQPLCARILGWGEGIYPIQVRLDHTMRDRLGINLRHPEWLPQELSKKLRWDLKGQNHCLSTYQNDSIGSATVLVNSQWEEYPHLSTSIQ